MKKSDLNLTWHSALVNRHQRELRNGHSGAMLWFTGLSGAGKSSLANAVERRLHEMHIRTYLLDGDNLRQGLCGDLGFSDADRTENIRRVGEVGKLLVDAGMVVMAAFISPFTADREKVKNLFSEKDYIEIYCNCPLSICAERDVKGLYRLAYSGALQNFTGVSSPYEIPESPTMSINTATLTTEECARQIIALLQQRGILGEVNGSEKNTLNHISK